MKASDATLLSRLPHQVRLTHVAETISTNEDAKKAAREGAPDYTLLIADRQTGGKGRLGRSFYSEGGLYMSILLPFREDFSLVTPVAAIAVARAIESVCGVKSDIKWVNDVYVRGKKVCGILAESAVAGDKRRIVLGIGVNLNTPANSFPEEIRRVAGSVSGDRNLLAASILEHLFSLLDREDSDHIRREYIERCFLVGHRVNVKKENGCIPATVLGLTDTLALSVRYDDGEREDLIAGEVSIGLFEGESR